MPAGAGASRFSVTVWAPPPSAVLERADAKATTGGRTSLSVRVTSAESTATPASRPDTVTVSESW